MLRIRISKFLAALVVPLAIYALATPSFAQTQRRSDEQRTRGGDSRLHQQGREVVDTYRACMAQHGQRE
jgi:hypothetical protein